MNTNTLGLPVVRVTFGQVPFFLEIVSITCISLAVTTVAVFVRRRAGLGFIQASLSATVLFGCFSFIANVLPPLGKLFYSRSDIRSFFFLCSLFLAIPGIFTILIVCIVLCSLIFPLIRESFIAIAKHVTQPHRTWIV
ncbi:hypothetical protein QBC42DRAFT_278638 [Cladorrhinum samala]|uniref:Uncharacterized protein n=1 Tax=Cladorrhinum samala TaxID=585594 RepID=A0AAV9H9E0_9PEZI|nr:hypothetical protein QBC42DRAFT_278638 [Cladorrhinum samala]